LTTDNKHWTEVMDLAKQYGFVVQAYGGTAVLVTHKNQKESWGEEEHRRIQKMNGRCLKELGYNQCETGCNSCYLNSK